MNAASAGRRRHYLVLGGGLLVHQPQLRDAVRQALAGDGLTDLRPLNRDPAYGALFLAQQLSTSNPTTLVRPPRRKMIMTTETRSVQTIQPGALMAAEIAEHLRVWRGLLAASVAHPAISHGPPQ